MPATTHERCEDLLADMVGFDTVNTNISGKPAAEHDLACFLERVAQQAGFATQRLPVEGESFNLLVTHQVDSAKPWLLFESHMDTVSVEGMTIEPFKPVVKDGKMFGRGSCDTKGTGAAMFTALKQYAAESDQPTNIAIAFTTDEEISKKGVRAFTREHLPQLGWQPVGAIVGEPTLLKPVVAHNGIARWSIVTKGVAAHSADPSKGKSAISMMLRVVDMIEQQYAPSLTATHPLTGEAQCTVNVIRGGVQVNIIPEHCKIQIDRRVVPGEDNTTVIPAVEKLLDRLRVEHPDINVQQQTPYLDPPLDPKGGEAFAESIGDALGAMNLPGEPTGVRYGTDASQFSEVGVPAVVLGPGSIEQAHTKDEWLELDQLHRGVDVYLNLMRADWESLR